MPPAGLKGAKMATNVLEPLTLNLEQVENYTGLSIKTWRKKIAAGEIEAVRVPNCTRILLRKSDVDRLLLGEHQQ
jgi:excisionase family DNA binding protein